MVQPVTARLALVGVFSMAVVGVLIFVAVRYSNNRQYITCQWTRIDNSAINGIDCAAPGEEYFFGFGGRFEVSSNATKIFVGVKRKGMCFFEREEGASGGYALKTQVFEEDLYDDGIAMSDSGDVSAYIDQSNRLVSISLEPHPENITTVVLGNRNKFSPGIYSMELSGDGNVLAVLTPSELDDSAVALFTFRRDSESPNNNEWTTMTDTATLFQKLDARWPDVRFGHDTPIAVSFDGSRIVMAWHVQAEATENFCDEREFRVMVMDYNETSRVWEVVAEKTSVGSNPVFANAYTTLSVSITPNGDTIAIGNAGASRGECITDDRGSLTKGLEGSVTVYDLQGNHLLRNGTIDGRVDGGRFGSSVSLGPDGDTLVISQRTQRDNSIQYYGYRDERWVPISDPIVGDAFLGDRVVLDPTGNFLVTNYHLRFLGPAALQVYSKECSE